MCVGVMEMVDAVCGGVLYSANPIEHPGSIGDHQFGLGLAQGGG
jgi:hypothetical protein